MNSGVYAARCSALTVGDILCKEYAFVFVIFSASDVWFFYLISSKLKELMLCLENANPRTISLTLAFLMFYPPLPLKALTHSLNHRGSEYCEMFILHF